MFVVFIQESEFPFIHLLCSPRDVSEAQWTHQGCHAFPRWLWTRQCHHVLNNRQPSRACCLFTTSDLRPPTAVTHLQGDDEANDGRIPRKPPLAGWTKGAEASCLWNKITPPHISPRRAPITPATRQNSSKLTKGAQWMTLHENTGTKEQKHTASPCSTPIVSSNH